MVEVMQKKVNIYKENYIISFTKGTVYASQIFLKSVKHNYIGKFLIEYLFLFPPLCFLNKNIPSVLWGLDGYSFARWAFTRIDFIT